MSIPRLKDENKQYRLINRRKSKLQKKNKNNEIERREKK